MFPKCAYILPIFQILPTYIPPCNSIRCLGSRVSVACLRWSEEALSPERFLAELMIESGLALSPGQCFKTSDGWLFHSYRPLDRK